MAETLTYQQKMAVENRGGKLLISAAAGSGKTKVLVDRLLRYVLDSTNPANVDDFLIITYTKAAASELRAKIAAKLSEHIAENPRNRHLQQQMQRLYMAKISTVHGFCADVLREYAYKLDISADFRVADEGECAQLQLRALEETLNRAYEDTENNDDFRAFIDTQGLGRDDRQIPEIVLKVYQSARCHMNPQQWLDWCIPSNELLQLQDASQTIWGEYLISDLKAFLSRQIQSLSRCVDAASDAEGMENPVALLRSTVDQLSALNACNSWDDIVEFGPVDFGRLTFSKKCTDQALAEQIKAIRNHCKTGLEKRLRTFVDKSDQVFEDLSLCTAAARGLVGLVERFTKLYHSYKQARGLLDFGDLEHLTLDLLLGRSRHAITAAAVEIGNRFLEIMVDEYQDSNEIQDAIFNALTEKRKNCFMVGDVKQSIYQFRLADPEIFLQKYNTYAAAETAKPGEGRRILLNSNFRSSAGVIDGVNDVFQYCMSTEVGGLEYGEDEMLREGIPHVSLPEPEVSLFAVDVDSDTYAEEARFVADEIEKLLDGNHYVRHKDSIRPIKEDDIAILLRSPGSVGGEFQLALQRKGIRCVTGDSADLLQTDEVNTLISILEIIHNPQQDIPLAAAMTSPVFGFTAEELAVLRSSNRNCSLYRLLTDGKEPKVQDFLSALNHLRKQAPICSVTQLLSEVFRLTDMLSVYASMPDGRNRLDNLQHFYQITSDYEVSGQNDLGRYLDFVRASRERGLGKGGNQQEKGAVTMMSIHKSKGLEFPVVFLCGLSRSFNQESARQQVLCDKELGLGLNCVNLQQRIRYPSIAKRAIARKTVQQCISEEMRVLYVAMTRAKDFLMMTYASKYLEKDLQDIALRLKFSSRRLMTAEVDCPGTWILQTAMTRTEAGELFAVGGNPQCGTTMSRPWKIRLVSAPGEEDAVLQLQQEEQCISREMMEQLAASMEFCYPHSQATQTPSKLTATQLKGRQKDIEVSEGTEVNVAPIFRSPNKDKRSSRGKELGNAMHSVLQYIDFLKCGSLGGIQEEIQRLIDEHLISSEQAAMVDSRKIANFFSGSFGIQLLNAECVLREFKFSILDDACRYYPTSQEEKILLQGVVDCAIVTDQSIQVVDFKTDFVTESTLAEAVDRYRPQVSAYVRALERIYQKPVSYAGLYFFALDKFVAI